MIIGLDVGGTHTDVVLLDENSVVKEIKVPTDSADLFKTVLTGLDQITEDIDSKEISRLVLSTTLTTNAITQKKIPKVGMIISSGPGIDPLEFRTNEHYFTVAGSMDHRGREIEPIDEKEITSIVKKLKDLGVEYVGVVGKFSVRNPDHETKIEKVINNSFEKVFLGHLCSGNLNFPRRIATTFLKAVAFPTHKKFFEAVKKSLDEKGLNIPIHILKADGGTISFEASIDYPAQTILSGPSASVMGAIAFAPEDGDVVVLDIGGTTTDMAVLINRAPVLDPVGIELGSYKTHIRSLKTRSIALGGDSELKIVDGKLNIGPGRLGPAMAHGGPAPTPTDALFVLGMVKNGEKQKAMKGIESIAMELGTSIEDAAETIFNSCCKEILTQIRHMVDRINSKPVYTVHELREGYQVKPDKILVLGGPAPYFAERLEKISGLKARIVPRWRVANAIGAALARTTCEVTLFADTEQKVAIAPEEKFYEKIDMTFSKKDAIEKAYDLLEKKALSKGAGTEDLEMEILEELEFNMVRGFSTTGKNIRVKTQVKPGLIHDYEPIVKSLSSEIARLKPTYGSLITNLLKPWY
jgi:N-methylhydantoinase A